jgi:hypothetical protein
MYHLLLIIVMHIGPSTEITLADENRAALTFQSKDECNEKLAELMVKLREPSIDFVERNKESVRGVGLQCRPAVTA